MEVIQPEKNVEALLRTYIQPLKNIHFIFCGSNKSMMTEMFTHAKRPFFASTRLLYLDKINQFEYEEFIRNHFAESKKHIEDEALAMDGILKENESFFFQYRQLLTPAQWNYLIAIAKEDEVPQITAQKFIAKYNIGTPANSKRIIKSLIEKELILENVSKEHSTYQVYDLFLSRWLQVRY